MPYKSSLEIRFNASIKQVEELLAIHTFLMRSPNETIDNVLRAALAMLVSAVDTFIHELVINAILFENDTGSLVFDLKGVTIPIDIIKIPDDQQRKTAIARALRKQYGKESFQSSAKIESALASIGIKQLWQSISSSMNMTPSDMKLTLNLLVQRRNQIVHEGDLDHFHEPREIFREDVDAANAFCKRFFNSLYNLYTEKLGAR